jgi:hypothetical protein
MPGKLDSIFSKTVASLFACLFYFLGYQEQKNSCFLSEQIKKNE